MHGSQSRLDNKNLNDEEDDDDDHPHSLSQQKEKDVLHFEPRRNVCEVVGCCRHTANLDFCFVLLASERVHNNNNKNKNKNNIKGKSSN